MSIIGPRSGRAGVSAAPASEHERAVGLEEHLGRRRAPVVGGGHRRRIGTGICDRHEVAAAERRQVDGSRRCPCSRTRGRRRGPGLARQHRVGRSSVVDGASERGQRRHRVRRPRTSPAGPAPSCRRPGRRSDRGPARPRPARGRGGRSRRATPPARPGTARAPRPAAAVAVPRGCLQQRGRLPREPPGRRHGPGLADREAAAHVQRVEARSRPRPPARGRPGPGGPRPARRPPRPAASPRGGGGRATRTGPSGGSPASTPVSSVSVIPNLDAPGPTASPRGSPGARPGSAGAARRAAAAAASEPGPPRERRRAPASSSGLSTATHRSGCPLDGGPDRRPEIGVGLADALQRDPFVRHARPPARPPTRPTRPRSRPARAAASRATTAGTSLALSEKARSHGSGKASRSSASAASSSAGTDVTYEACRTAAAAARRHRRLPAHADSPWPSRSAGRRSVLDDQPDDRGDEPEQDRRDDRADDRVGREPAGRPAADREVDLAQLSAMKATRAAAPR